MVGRDWSRQGVRLVLWFEPLCVESGRHLYNAVDNTLGKQLCLKEETTLWASYNAICWDHIKSQAIEGGSVNNKDRF